MMRQARQMHFQDEVEVESDLDETEIEGAETEGEEGEDKKPGAKRGRKSKAEMEALKKSEEDDKIHEIEFKERGGIDSEGDAFRLTCGKCIFYEKLATYGKPCIKRGIVAKDKPCKRYQFNTETLTRSKIPHLVKALSELCQSGATLTELAALTASARSSRLGNYKLGQTIWFSTTPHADRQTADTWWEAVVIGGRDGKIRVLTNSGMQSLLPPNMLLTEAEFAQIKMKIPPAKREALEKIHGLKIRTIDDAPPALAQDKPTRKPGAKAKPALRKSQVVDDEDDLVVKRSRKSSVKLRG